jgi:hypothetical protein
MKTKLLFLALILGVKSFSQIAIPNTTAVTENFNSMLISATANMPANWKMSSAGAGSPTWGAVGNFTAVSQQAASGSPTAGGRYNWGDSSTIDRCLGIMTSGGYSSPNSIMAYYKNTNSSNLTQLVISYAFERYRVNTATASVSFFYSLDGITWVSITSGDITSGFIATGANAYSYPGLSITKSPITISGLNIPTNGDIYLRWNLDTTGTNSQGIGIDDVSVSATFTAACTPATLTTVTPSTGPIGTEVTINASSGTLVGATATFNGVAATVVSSTITQLVVKIPTGATNGNLVVTNASSCASLPIVYNIIDKDISSCQGSSALSSDLIIYEVHDEFSGSGGTITLFNNTATTKTLSNYRIYRTSNQGDGLEVNYAALTGTIAPGALGIITVALSACAPAATNGSVTGGFNAFDEIQLRSSALVIIDKVYTPNNVGYYMKRNLGSYTPRTVYTASDWGIISLAAGVCAPGLATTPVAGTKNTPSITSQPAISLSCNLTSTTLTVVANEGLVGGNALTYQWFAVAPNTTSWTTLANAGIYSGVNLATLSISNVSGIVGYQFYCEVREDTATCYQATIPVKIVLGSGTTTWNGTSWNNGTPTLTSLAIISGTYDMTLGVTRPSIDACSLNITSGTVTVSSGKYINIQNDLTIDFGATLNVLDKGSLIQISDPGLNTINGTFTMARAVNQNISRSDYVYWSSPVTSFPIANVSSTTAANKIWEWTPFGNFINSPTFGTGNWLNASGNMTVGKGYIIRGPSTSLVPLPFSASYSGVPNNGIITPSISRGTYNSGTYFGTNGRPITDADDNWNLIGNPYPSAIKTLDFLALNSNIEGAIRLWTHGTPLSTTNPNPFYNSYAANYAVSDYITYNGTGTTSGPAGFNGFIASGQSFFVNMNDSSGLAFETITFKNSLRSSGYDNSQFYKTTNVATANPEQGRIWLNLVSNSTNEVSRILVGYVPNATNQKDRMFDALNVYGGAQTFSSLINGDMMMIQGRALPFDNQDIVPLAVELVSAGNFSIAISEVDGLFSNSNQSIFLQDNLLNITHDLRQAPYQFTSLVGDFKNRFIMKYTNAALSNSSFSSQTNAVIVTSKDQKINVFSNTEKIDAIEIYDVLGRKLFETNNINDRSFSVANLSIETQSLIVKIKLENGDVVTKKVVL